MPDRIGELASMEGYSPQEADFQFGIRSTPWFSEFAQQHGEPNLNDPNYDYRAAWAAGARPNVRDPGDNQYHWPSQFKGPEHPNRFVNGVDTITGQPVSTGEEYAGLGGDPRHLANTIKDWWVRQQSWSDRAKAENQKTSEAFQRGGMGAVAQQLATDTTEAQDLVSAFGVGNIKGVGGKVVAPGALAAVDEYRPPFYSAVEQAVQGAKQNAAPGQQWAGFLRNQPGVKPEEVEALKLGTLFEQPGSVPKRAVLGEVAANRVNVGEVIKGTPHNYPYRSADEWEAAIARAEARGDWDEGVRLTQAQEGVNPATGSTAGSTKFSQYTLPGGENYREMLLTLPEGGPVINRMKDIQRRLGEINELPAAVHQGPDGPKILAEFDALQSEKARLRHEIPPTFKSSHYDEPNILAHVRYNDRVIDGKKTLFVEEVQSDWHQKGKREGYRLSSEQTTPMDAEYRQLVHKNADARAAGQEPLAADIARAQELENALIKADKSNVPDAPFKTTWPELAMKRIIREAAEKGYDKVAWTPGSVQAERYDLSKHIDRLHYNPDAKELYAFKDNKMIINKDGVEPKDLADIVGKDVAEKLVNAPIDKTRNPAFGRVHALEGVDLKVGGEGMKGFYDEILPATVNKLVKKHGGRVQQGVVPVGHSGFDVVSADGRNNYSTFGTHEAAERWAREWGNHVVGGVTVRENPASKQSVHTIDITPSLRAQAMKGFPLFTAGGVAATGIMGEMARQDEYR